MSCISPCAPACDTALGSNPDSARTTALTSAGGTPLAFAAATMSASYGDGSPRPAAASPGGAGAEPNCDSSMVWKLSPVASASGVAGDGSAAGA
jgi:hypothetical protein